MRSRRWRRRRLQELDRQQDAGRAAHGQEDAHAHDALARALAGAAHDGLAGEARHAVGPVDGAQLASGSDDAGVAERLERLEPLGLAVPEEVAELLGALVAGRRVLVVWDASLLDASQLAELVELRLHMLTVHSRGWPARREGWAVGMSVGRDGRGMRARRVDGWSRGAMARSLPRRAREV